MNILLTGGTGVLGRKVVDELLQRGIKPRVLSRKPQQDLRVDFVQGNLLGAGSLAQGLSGIEVIIHLASNPRSPKEDLIATSNLLHAAKAAGVGHIVLVSIVGIDPMGWMPYYRVKKQVENLVAAFGIPHTTLRAAQFHEFVAFIIHSLGKGGIQILPDFTLQPIQTEAVAKRLVEAALSKPAGRLPDLVGPEPRGLVSLGKEYLAAMGQRKSVLAIPLPSFISRLWRPIGDASAQRVGESWSQWLAEHATQRNPYGGAI